MSTHWTYCTAETGSDLQQGDIIGRKDELLDVLQGVHSYFCDERYIAFLVLTQSCDLVRRKRGQCKARYISIATVRELDQVLPGIIHELSGTHHQSVLLRERKSVAKEFLHRLIDQNEQSRGLFYLHPSADAGIAVASLAFLRVTITLRQEHYDVLARCRVGRLQPEFSNKLGWLVGNLYSRIGTPDWDDKAGDSMGDQLITQYLSDAAPDCRWVPEAWVRAAQSKRHDFSADIENPVSELASYAPPSALDVVLSELHRSAVAVRVDTVSKLLKERVKSDQPLLTMVIGDIVAMLPVAPAESDWGALARKLQESGKFSEAVAVWITSIVAKAKNCESIDPFKEAIDAARLSNVAIPPVKDIVEQLIAEVANELPANASTSLGSAPALGESTLDRIASILEEFGNSQWAAELQKIKGRLLNNSKLKSAVG